MDIEQIFWIGLRAQIYLSGVKYQTTMDTIYGWVRVNIPFANNFVKNCYVKDYSTTGFVDAINEINLGPMEVALYPNPVNNTLNVLPSNFKTYNSEIEIVNTLGQTVLKQKSIGCLCFPKGFIP